MRYVSVFSGIEAATVAWEPLGWEPVAFCENDPFPSAVLAQRFPDVPNLGDITKVDWSEYAGKVDVVVGGSPCQSFSIAGDRTGLGGASGLMWEYVRCVHHVCPKWFVWENVPGALSSTNGEDFRCLLQAMDDLGYGLAWRVLDAQFFGVPQRRRRVFLVGSLGNRRAADVLFEREGLCRDTEPNKEARKKIADRVGKSFDESLFCLADECAKTAIDRDMCGTLKVGGSAPMMITKNEARRLTPRECERLQGFPDDWTLVEWRGGQAPNGRRYKALGNSMAVPVMRWIGERMQMVEEVSNGYV